MERALSLDNKIKKAEEIYQKRKTGDLRQSQARVNVANSKRNYKLFKKMLIQLAFCSIIYILFYCIKNCNYVFSDEFITQAKSILSYDINIKETYENIVNWFSNMENSENIENITEQSIEEANNTDTNNENIITQIEDIADAVSEEEQTLSVSENEDKTTEPLSDAEIIKKNYSIIKPLIGTITSRFGTRNPTTPTVPVYHTGIDIAANTGTVFIAAMSGTVVQVSSEGDYGNHVKIAQNEVETLYAHCSKIYVNEGDTIYQGQEIGEVGETGNATGPHLHFEIRKSGNYINPDDILEF